MEQSAGQVIQACLEAHGFEAGRSAPALLRLCELLAQWNRRSNLTGQATVEAIASGLCADAVALAGLLPEVRGMVDLGSGA